MVALGLRWQLRLRRRWELEGAARAFVGAQECGDGGIYSPRRIEPWRVANEGIGGGGGEIQLGAKPGIEKTKVGDDK